MRIQNSLTVFAGVLCIALFAPACGSGSFDVDPQDSGTTETDTDTDTDSDADTDADSDTDSDTDTDVILTASDCTAECGDDWCIPHPALGDSCATECHPERRAADGLCCPLGSEAVSGTCPLPDLWVARDRLAGNLSQETKNFGSDSCELLEGCINAAGNRKLLRFDTTTPNTGVGDLHFGDPNTASDLFVYSDCHNHYHFESYAAYDLRDDVGNIVATGHKQAFCLMDFETWGAEGRGEYTCGYQGIAADWADTYSAYLDCQWVDVTDVAPGDYQLTVRVNTEQYVAESDYTNNSTQTPVTIR
ncbi:MAG: hypothetical protein KC912_19620 [Proteobacteria bacterium]|nr:hypothetical protein [Pseudomonadota bacterium]